jgi:hypothetical protein
MVKKINSQDEKNSSYSLSFLDERGVALKKGRCLIIKNNLPGTISFCKVSL